MNKFKYINRHHKKDLVLLPGWATDHRVFERLDKEYNYIVPVDFDPYTFAYDLVQYLQDNGFKKVSVYGWSLGGFCGADFAVRYPYAVDEVILVGVKEKYDTDGITRVKKLLSENKKAYLYKFYRDCFFAKDKESYLWFKENLMKDYLDVFSDERLIKGLDYFLKTPLDIKKLAGMKVRLVYGAADKIVPAAEIMSLKGKIPSVELDLIDGRGHFVF